MSLVSTIKKTWVNLLNPTPKTGPAKAYNLWASTYDNQPENMVLYLDEIVVTEILEKVILQEKIIADVGCGTGRYWEKILSKKPSALIGYDVSIEMLSKLHHKYPQAETYLLQENNLKESKDESCDIIISTLVVAHIQNLEQAFIEWNRVLKNNGEIIITDFHPQALQNGATRSFRYKDKPVYIKNYVHSLKKIRAFAKKLKWEEVCLIEKTIDESVKGFFKGEEALDVFRNNYNMPVLYAIHFIKKC